MKIHNCTVACTAMDFSKNNINEPLPVAIFQLVILQIQMQSLHD